MKTSPAVVGENGSAERVIRTLQQEKEQLKKVESLIKARQGIGHFINAIYISERILIEQAAI